MSSAIHAETGAKPIKRRKVLHELKKIWKRKECVTSELIKRLKKKAKKEAKKSCKCK